MNNKIFIERKKYSDSILSELRKEIKEIDELKELKNLSLSANLMTF